MTAVAAPSSPVASATSLAKARSSTSIVASCGRTWLIFRVSATAGLTAISDFVEDASDNLHMIHVSMR